MQQEIMDALKDVMPWQARVFKMPRSTMLPQDWEPERHDLGDRYYSYIINHWIHNQPDSAALMKLFILCRFDLFYFARLIISGGGGGRKTGVAA